MGIRKKPFGDALKPVRILEPCDRHGTKNLLRSGESAEKILERAGIAERRGDSARHHAFGDAGRTKKKHVLTGYCGKQDKTKEFFFLVDSTAQLCDQTLDTF